MKEIAPGDVMGTVIPRVQRTVREFTDLGPLIPREKQTAALELVGAFREEISAAVAAVHLSDSAAGLDARIGQICEQVSAKFRALIPAQ